MAREKSDAFLKGIGPRPLTLAEHDHYVDLAIEEGSLRTGEGVQTKIIRGNNSEGEGANREGEGSKRPSRGPEVK